MSVATKISAPRPAPKMGRPANPETERLVAYGLRLSPDKKMKLTKIKDFQGQSIREWVEEHIERDYLAMIEKRAEVKADRAVARGK